MTVAVTTVLGGVTTCAVAYLLSERILRASDRSRAVSYGAPSRPALPGVRTRGMLGWALGSGVPLLGLGIVAVATITGDEVSDDELAIVIFALGGLAFTVGLLITWLTTRAVADPVLSVRRALAEVERGELEVEVPVYDGSELGLLQAGFNRMAAGLGEREKMRDLFGRHVGEDVAHAALEQEIELGGEVRDVAVLFVDIVGSTELAATRPPHEVVELLNAFFEVVVEVVDEHGGFVNKFEGDAALAIFGAPIPRDETRRPAPSPPRATWPSACASEVPDLRAGIGVSGGQAVAGNVGAEKRFEYTVIGDPVNEAARLSELAKEEGGVLASADLVEEAGEEEARTGRRGAASSCGAHRPRRAWRRPVELDAAYEQGSKDDVLSRFLDAIPLVVLLSGTLVAPPVTFAASSGSTSRSSTSVRSRSTSGSPRSRSPMLAPYVGWLSLSLGRAPMTVKRPARHPPRSAPCARRRPAAPTNAACRDRG